MALTSTYKVLAQVDPVVTTLTDAYTVPALTQAIISTIVICNRAAATASYRISVAIAGAADATKQYLAYDTPIAGNSSHTLTLGITLGPGDKVRVYDNPATVSFNISGVEIA